MKQKFFITTPIYYATSNPHIGHTYTTLAGDITARFMRMMGYDVYLLVGTDEHGQKIKEKAKKENKEPKIFVDEISQIYKDTWKAFDISYSYFIRTTDDDHKDTVQQFIKSLEDKSFIYKGKYQGYYCQGCEDFITTKELTEEGFCPMHQTKPQLIEEENYFFKLSAFKEKLIEWHNANTELFNIKEKQNEMMEIISKHLNDTSISRPNVNWGISYTNDPNQKVYVWIDALINYLTYGNKENIWPPNIHFIGKEINKFHSIYWPAMLMANEYPLPKRFVVNGFITVEGQKMSKTIGNVIYPLDLLHNYNRDAIVFYLFNETKYGHDFDFSYTQIEDRYKTELANKYGNLFNRSLMLSAKNDVHTLDGNLTDEHNNIINEIEQIFIENMMKQNYKESLETAWKLLSFSNTYIDQSKPWELFKTNPSKALQILYTVFETIRVFALLTMPFFPHTNSKVLNILGLDYDIQNNTLASILDRKDSFALQEKSAILYEIKK